MTDTQCVFIRMYADMRKRIKTEDNGEANGAFEIS